MIDGSASIDGASKKIHPHFTFWSFSSVLWRDLIVEPQQQQWIHTKEAQELAAHTALIAEFSPSGSGVRGRAGASPPLPRSTFAA